MASGETERNLSLLIIGLASRSRQSDPTTVLVETKASVTVASPAWRYRLLWGSNGAQ